ncbi:MAG: AmmeMemoRadiSam system radical SAM enzyme [Candidatus Sumerlaeaceae bacterium]
MTQTLAAKVTAATRPVARHTAEQTFVGGIGSCFEEVGTAMTPTQGLKEVLDTLTQPAAPELVELHPSGKLRCLACGHRCLLAPGARGVCKVRSHDGQTLQVPWGYVAGLNVDPIEKKPFFHFLPGSDALSFGMLGCNFRCDYCQNWLTSQALRDPAADPSHYGSRAYREITPEQVVALAVRHGARVVTSTYNEPLITSEWAVDIFRLAKAEGLKCTYVSNGFATPEVLDFLAPWLDGMKVDLKGMREASYRRLGGRLSVVLDTIKELHRRGIWTEIVTLVVPGFNDSPEELRELARFIANVSPDIPWHVTAFHSDYKMSATPSTRVDQLVMAANIGREEGLRYVYAGNIPGAVGDLENTRCPQCHSLLVKRFGFAVLEKHISGDGQCPQCGAAVPGVWR